jgi:hypothetical protein
MTNEPGQAEGTQININKEQPKNIAYKPGDLFFGPRPPYKMAAY